MRDDLGQHSRPAEDDVFYGRGNGQSNEGGAATPEDVLGPQHTEERTHGQAAFPPGPWQTGRTGRRPMLS